MFKPQLANDANLDSLIYPVIAQPKIDGVRAINFDGRLTGRSLDPFAGFGITEYFSNLDFVGFDGEMVLGPDPAADRLCSLTTGAMGKFKGVTEMPNLHWHLFDLVLPRTIGLAYSDRYEILQKEVLRLGHPRLHLVPSIYCGNRTELDAVIATCFQQGYEGTIIRNPRANYKEGRPSKKAQELVRVKPWSDFEVLVTGITEGEENQNVAKTNTLGRTERSSAQDGMIPNGQVGSIQGTLLEDFYSPITSELLFKKGLPITCGSGKMTVKEATHYFQNQHEIVGHIVKVKTMIHGVKNLPRFPTFVSLRMKEDL